MKSFIVFALVIAGISALSPQLTKGLLTSDERLVTDSIASAIEEVSQSIRNAGLDPLHVPLEQASYELPVPVLFSFFGKVKEFHFKGLSDIQITRLTFGTLTLRLRLDLKLPRIEATLDNAEINAVFFGQNINLSTSGRFAVKEVTVETDINVRIGIITGISISSVDVSFKVGGIESKMAVSGFGRDISSFVNHFIGTVVPETLNEFKGDINELIEIVLLDVINDNL